MQLHEVALQLQKKTNRCLSKEVCVCEEERIANPRTSGQDRACVLKKEQGGQGVVGEQQEMRPEG